ALSLLAQVVAQATQDHVKALAVARHLGSEHDAEGQDNDAFLSASWAVLHAERRCDELLREARRPGAGLRPPAGGWLRLARPGLRRSGGPVMIAPDRSVFLIGCPDGAGPSPPEATPQALGFKAYNLWRMAGLGLPVPPAF
ncbi:hypothetical protein KXX11_004442, partial [Aspergillus fumigatus]